MNDIKKEHAFKTFNLTLKNGNFKNVILLFGVEDYLVRWAYESLEKKYISNATKALDLVKLESDSSINDIIEACETFSMFSNMRIVLVNEFLPLKNEKAKGYGNDDIKNLLSYIENINKGTFLVFKCSDVNKNTELYKGISKIGDVFEFDRLDEMTLTSFINKEFKKNGSEPDKGIIKYLIDGTGYFNKESDYRISNLINDIIKISAYSGKDKITKESIDAVLIGDMESFVFDFLDALSNGRKELAFSMLENILKDSDIYQLTGLLINQFELMLEALQLSKSGMTLNEVVSRLKLHEFRVKKALYSADKIGIDKIKETLISLYEVDRNIKTGTLDGRIALEIIVSKI